MKIQQKDIVFVKGELSGMRVASVHTQTQTFMNEYGQEYHFDEVNSNEGPAFGEKPQATEIPKLNRSMRIENLIPDTLVELTNHGGKVISVKIHMLHDDGWFTAQNHSVYKLSQIIRIIHSEYSTENMKVIQDPDYTLVADLSTERGLQKSSGLLTRMLIHRESIADFYQGVNDFNDGEANLVIEGVFLVGAAKNEYSVYVRCKQPEDLFYLGMFFKGGYRSQKLSNFLL